MSGPPRERAATASPADRTADRSAGRTTTGPTTTGLITTGRPADAAEEALGRELRRLSVLEQRALMDRRRRRERRGRFRPLTA